jgi:hypothetical protein
VSTFTFTLIRVVIRDAHSCVIRVCEAQIFSIKLACFCLVIVNINWELIVVSVIAALTMAKIVKGVSRLIKKLKALVTVVSVAALLGVTLRVSPWGRPYAGPVTVNIRRVDRITSEVGSPLTIDIDCHLEYQVSAVGIITGKGGQKGTSGVLRVDSAVVGCVFPRNHKGSVSRHVTSVLIGEVQNTLHRHSVECHCLRLGGIDRALILAERVAVAITAGKGVTTLTQDQSGEE